MITKNKIESKVSSICVLSLLFAGGVPAFGAPLPEAGVISQQNKTLPSAPIASDFVIEFNGNALAETPPGGPVAVLNELVISGNTVFDDSTILIALGDVSGKEYDLAGFRELANQVSQFYRDRGYPFARAYIPAQTMQEGILQIDVLEGRYDLARVSAPADVRESAQAYVSSITTGEVIEARKLERVSLIMNDIAGYRAVSSISPGSETGTANLDVLIQQTKRLSGDITIDNQGSRYTGYHRAQVGVNYSNLFMFADSVSARVMYTDEQMVFGSIDYGWALNSDGLRMNIALSRTDYELGREYSSLDAVGVADSFELSASYPIIRSQAFNLRLKGGIESKDLEDQYRASDSQVSKSIYSIPVSLTFDSRDQFLGGGVSYGGISSKLGRVDNDSSALFTAKYFSKLNVDFSRIQSLPMNMTFFAKVSAQWSAKNLDSSEDLYVGGASAVRAYPPGEAGENGGADHGFLSQFELRYKHNDYSPYIFYDYGSVNTAADPTESFENIKRDLSGAGIGLRYERAGWSADIFAAWRIEGGEAVYDTYMDTTPRVAGFVTYRF